MHESHTSFLPFVLQLALNHHTLSQHLYFPQKNGYLLAEQILLEPHSGVIDTE